MRALAAEIESAGDYRKHTRGMRRQRRQIGCVRDEYADRDFDRPIINMPLESVHQLANRQPDYDSGHCQIAQSP